MTDNESNNDAEPEIAPDQIPTEERDPDGRRNRCRGITPPDR